MQERKRPFKRVLALILACVMLLGLAMPAAAASPDSVSESSAAEAVKGTPVNGRLTDLLSTDTAEETADPNEMVRVSIVLEKQSTLEAGFATQNIAANASAMSYRDSLRTEQATVESAIERATGKALDVVWHLTLAANIISANVRRGDIEKIAAVDGVAEVVEETLYSPAKVSVGGELQPNMAVSAEMTGASQAWAVGYTGEGSLIAIIDTGLDVKHQAFDEAAFLESVDDDADLKLTEEKYKDLDLTQLHAYESDSTLSAEKLFVNAKIPYGFNYIDEDYRIDHQDSEGEHGSHVAGIAAANKLVKSGTDFVDAADVDGMVGNAPDAQLMIMKVFGTGGGAYDSDYMAAIEDAIYLGADSCNLSLGSGDAGMTTSGRYQSVMDKLVKNGTLMGTSHGNNASWGDNLANNDTGATSLSADDVNFDTAGSPGSFTNTVAVASVDNDGFVGTPIGVSGHKYGYSQSNYKNEPISTLDTSTNKDGTTLKFVFIDGIGSAEQFAAVKDKVQNNVVLCKRGTSGFSEKANAAAAAGAAAVIIVNNQPGVINMDLSDYTYTKPVISIIQAFGDEIWEENIANKGHVDDGSEKGLDYVTGDITIYSAQEAVNYKSTYKTMSSFSSWGTTGDLAIKPEITAPGGNIYSVWGANSASDAPTDEHDQYELMSGTSMAAPQITGITALIQQHLRKLEIETTEDPGAFYKMTNALLMSTATPLYASEGHYYSVLQQGAGLANAAGAVTTQNYISIPSRDDGKVKVELKDDPERKGEYTIEFDVKPLEENDVSYTVSASFFTQEVKDGDLLDTTTPLKAEVTGNEDPVKANGHVTLTITLDEEEAKALDELKHKTGFYVEGYITLTPASTKEGVLPPTLSIPVLGYYGSWTDPSMFDEDGYYFGEDSGLIVNGSITSGIGAGSTVSGYAYSLIRNAGAGAVLLQYEENGQSHKQFLAKDLSAASAAYYSSSYGFWTGTASTASFSWTPNLPEDAENVTVSLIMAPEYYADEEGKYDWDKLTDGKTEEGNKELGKGAYLTTSVSIDTEPPTAKVEVVTADQSEDDRMHIYVTVCDNNSVIDVYMSSYDGETLVREFNPAISDGDWLGDPNFEPTGPNVEKRLDFDGFYVLESFLGYFFYDVYDSPLTPDVYSLSVTDAAGNEYNTKILAGVEPTEHPTGITLSASQAEIVKGSTYQLTATVAPSYIEDGTVTWKSSNDAVASVDANGLVTAKNTGTATITATTNAKTEDGTQLTAECEISVIAMNLAFTGILGDDAGDPQYFKWDLSSGKITYPAGAAPQGVNGIVGVGDHDDTYYVFDYSNNMYELDKATGKAVSDSPWAWSSESPIPWSMTYSDENLYGDYGLFWTYGYYLFVEDNPSAPEYMAFNFQTAGAPFFNAVASNGTPWTYNLDGEDYSGQYTLYAIDDESNVWEFMILQEDGGMSCIRGATPSDLPVTAIPVEDIEDYKPGCSLVVGSDGSLYYSIYNADKDTSELYRLVYNESENIWESSYLGSAGEGVWPALLLTIEESASDVKYDFDNNSVVNVKDAQLLLDHIVHNTELKFHGDETDVNNDGKTSTRDVYELLNKIGADESALTVPAVKGFELVKAQAVSPEEIKDLSKSAGAGKDSVAAPGENESDSNLTLTIPVSVENSANGRFTLSFDQNLLSMTGISLTDAALTSYASAAGKVDVGYAAKDELAEEVVAEVTFAYSACMGDQTTQLTLAVTEDGETYNETPEVTTIEATLYGVDMPTVTMDGVVVTGDSMENFETHSFHYDPDGFTYGDVEFEFPFAVSNPNEKGEYFVVEESNYDLYKVDADGKVLSTTPAWPGTTGFIPKDMAYVESEGGLYFVCDTYVIGPVSPDEDMGATASGFNLSGYGYPYFYGIDVVNEPWTYDDPETGEEIGGDYYLYLLDDTDCITIFRPYHTTDEETGEEGMSALLTRIPYSGDLDLGGYSMTADGYTSLVSDSGTLYFAKVNDEDMVSEFFSITIGEESADTTYITCAENNAWPALLTSASHIVSYDYNLDGVEDETDVQLLMDDVIKGNQIRYHLADRDVDMDGDIDTYDVHTLLTILNGTDEPETVRVSANEVTGVAAQTSLSAADFDVEKTEPETPESVVTVEPVESAVAEPVVEREMPGVLRGSLNSVEGKNDAITVDRATHTVTVPVSVEGTNGMFTLTFDPEVMSVESVSNNVKFNSYKDLAAEVWVGYADLEAVDEDIVVTFHYTGAPTPQETEISLIVEEDGAEHVEQVNTFTVSLPAVSSDTSISSVTVNGSQASMDADGNWSVSVMVGAVSYYDIKVTTTDEVATYALEETGNGAYTITVTAEDGTTATYTLTVNAIYVPAPGGSTTQPGTQPGDEPGTEPGENPPAEAPVFTDVPEDAWYAEAVETLTEMGVINGVSDTEFAPDEGLTRGMMAAVLYRLAGTPETSDTASFTDVVGGAWYEGPVAWANASGLMMGYGDGSFGVDDVITREQMAIVLWRYAQMNGYDVSADGFVMPNFSDIDEASDAAMEALCWAVRAGIMRGNGDNTITPKGTATRAQVVTMIANFLKVEKPGETN